MSDLRESAHGRSATDYTELLERLAGVLACNIKLNALGAIEEIHILSSASRNAKQVVRDARSALYSMYNLDIDYKKFSVAQIREELAEEIQTLSVVQETRLLSDSIKETFGGTQYGIAVTLRIDDMRYTGSATVRNTPMQRLRAAVDAVLSAIHQYLDQELTFSLMSVQRVASTPIPVIVVILECLMDDNPTLLVGAAEETKNEALSVERATLDAVNRKLAVLKSKEG